MANANNSINWNEVLDWHEENVLMVLWASENQALRADNYPAYESLYNELHDAMFEKFGVTGDQLEDEIERRLDS